MFKKWITAVSALVIGIASIQANAAVTVFDFETEADIAAWKIRTPSTDILKRSEKYATSGRYSMEFYTPKWYTGMQEWPAFDTVPSVTDWSGFDRLVVDITNPSDKVGKFIVILKDGNREFRKGHSEALPLPKNNTKRYVVDLNTIGKHLDMTDINFIHFFSERPEELRLYLDNLTLLKPGEPLPAMPDSFLNQILAFKEALLKKAEQAVADYEKDRPETADFAFSLLKNDLDSLRKVSMGTQNVIEKLPDFQKSVD